jgi:hypothetical protein
MFNSRYRVNIRWRVWLWPYVLCWRAIRRCAGKAFREVRTDRMRPKRLTQPACE